MGTTYIGPTQIECPQACRVPAGATVTVVPKPTRAWPEVASCPNTDCDRALLIVTVPVPAAKGT